MIGKRQINCSRTPKRNSYYCEEHKLIDNRVPFKFKTNVIYYRIEDIISTIKTNVSGELTIHDCFTDQFGNILYLITYNGKFQRIITKTF